MEERRNVRGRCEVHNLAAGPGGGCVLCRREIGVPQPRRSGVLRRVAIAAGVLTMLCGGAAFARGVGFSHFSAPRAPAFVEAAPQAPAPRAFIAAPPSEAEAAPPTVRITAPPAVAPQAPASRNPLDEALAVLPPERLSEPPASVVGGAPPAAPVAPCMCRARPPVRTFAPPATTTQQVNPWGSDHDSDGTLNVKSSLHAAWGRSTYFDTPPSPAAAPAAPPCVCPQGMVRVAAPRVRQR
jgi:hypothetical protein